MSSPKMKTLSFLLALLIPLSSIVACANTPTKTAETTAETSETTAQESETQTVYKADIPEGTDYQGKDFNIMVFGETTIVWYDVDFASDEENGETINDATYQRMRAAEEILNIKVNDIKGGAFGDSSVLKASVMANDGAYDCGFVNMFGAATISQGGYVMDLNKIQTLDLTQPWWDQNAVKDLSIAHKLFMVTGDIEIMYKKSIGIILFNKKMINDYSLELPYDLVANKTWTIDKLIEMAKGTSKDLNGDSVRDKNDQFGFLYYSDVIALGIIGGGVNMVTKDENDLPTLTFFSDRTVGIWEKYTSLFYDTDLSYSDNNEDVLKPMFIAGQALFDFNEFHAVEQLRQMDTDFGILPIPLYEEGQESYYHTINPHVGSVLVVPVDCPDLERVGYALDVLGAESKNILTPAYYDLYLKTKGARDDASEASIDLILSTLRYDLGYMYNWGTLADFTLQLVNNKKTDLASAYNKIEKSIQKNIDKAVEKYEEIEN
jgi:ABC-type sugar transport system, periplasmic component